MQLVYKLKNNIITILSYILIMAFIIRLFCYESTIGMYINLSSSPISKADTIISLILIYFQYTAVISLLIYNFIKVKYINNLIKYFFPLIFILNIIYNNSIVTLLSKEQSNILSVMLIIESVLGFILSIIHIVKEKFTKLSIKEIGITLGVFILLLIPTLPSYFIQFMFGYGNNIYLIKDITFEHRLMLYMNFIIPFIIFMLFKDKDENVRKYVLIYISIGVLVGFLVNYNYKTFTKPWTLPFHLCNTALFIIPLCLIFKLKKLFYFTYFINVLGALLAMCAPNYDDATNIFSMRMINFWYNHFCAFFMPILIVSLKIFERPKLKEFIYSMSGFLVYFLIALFSNVFFTSLSLVKPELNIGTVDYFFLNSNFIGEKLGSWAEKLFNITLTLNFNELQLVFHPVYQLIFFIVYIFLGLGVWFIYSECYRFSDDLTRLHAKLYEMKVKEQLEKEIFNNNIHRKDIDMTNEVVLELNHFSKKYANSKRFSVQDANLKVVGGEIFGFLGPNGAGKSTIIKSMVGIQSITSGNINVCGYDVTRDPVKAKYNIGYVPDHYALYEKLTGREYINYIADIYDVSLEERNERINKYLKIFELENSIDNKIKTYSHGMKQKITIISALVHNPKVWILDEPLTGLDPTSIFQVKECMKEHASLGNIVFFSSHLIDIVEKLCQKIAIISGGEIRCVKNVDEIENQNISLEKFYMDVIKENEGK